MREIKFRAWNIRNKIMIYGIHTMYDGAGEFTDELGNKISIYDIHGSPTSSFCEFLDDNDSVVMQFTGLQDKNGKDIYEGDIVENYAFRDIVIFDKGIFTTSRSTINHFGIKQALAVHEELEVIGNKYANPELLD